MTNAVMLYVIFQDAIRERDGSRVLSCWKFFLLFFKSSRQINYAFTTVSLLLPTLLCLVSSTPIVNQDLAICTWSTATIPICKIAVHDIGANTT